ncbi:MAG: thioredoxin domain-containing protein, partial [Gemmatimonadales bacterium]
MSGFGKILLLLLLVVSLSGCRSGSSLAQDPSATTPSTRTGLEMKSQPARTPAFIREHGNHLLDEPSLYLQQHSHNPLDWYPWGTEALERARRQDKPIFLSIGYSSCHWCHVMEHEVFEHDDVAEFMNRFFICIKVDREERPDLDRVYMAAVQMMTGRGGWPMSVFLTPDLKPFHGGTYYPHDDFLQVVQRITEIYREDRPGLEQQAAQVADRITSGSFGLVSADPDGTRPVGREVIDVAVQQAKQSFDPVHGGFLQRQKFPTPVKWRFLLHEYRRGGDPQLGEMIAKTCGALSGGGIYDHVGGGFHRYTVDDDWTVPHFEKMPYDNGQLAGLLLEAGVALERSDFIAAGTDVLDFLLDDMRAESGGFFGSFDADSGGLEGSYYVWSRREIAEVAGPVDGPALADLLGVDERGNFEDSGRSVLTLRIDRAGLAEIAARHGRSAEELGALFAKHRPALRAARDQRTPPGKDPKIVTSWNGLAIAALAQGYAVTGEEKYLSGARKAADFLLAEHRRADGNLMRASSGGRARGEGVLDDYAYLADALLELYQVSGRTPYLAAAGELVDFALAEFGRPEGGFFLSRQGQDAPLGRTVDAFDSVEPSGIAVMLGNRVKLSAITGRPDYRDRAQADLEQLLPFLQKGGLELAWWLDAVLKLQGPFYDVAIAGDPGRPETAEMIRALLSQLPAGAVLSRIPATGPSDELLALAPALAGKTA